MPLPVNNTPTFDVTLPSTGKPIKARPFLVREQKILLMAAESNNAKEVVDAVRQVISSTILTPVNVDALPLFDLEWIFTKLRIHSVGEHVIMRYRCLADKDGAKCKNIVEIDVNLSELQPPVIEKDGNIVMLNPTLKLGLKMRYPQFELMSQIQTIKTQNASISDMFALIADCVESVFDATKIYDQFTKDEMLLFLETMSTQQFQSIMDFFDTIPTMKTTIPFHCAKCGNSEDIKVEGISAFFA